MENRPGENHLFKKVFPQRIPSLKLNKAKKLTGISKYNINHAGLQMPRLVPIPAWLWKLA